MAMRAVFSSAPVAIWKRRLNKFSRLSARRRTSSSSESSLSSLALKEISLSLHALRLDGQLHPGEAHRLAGERLGHTGELEHDATGLDHGHPVLGRALAGAHAGLGGLLGHRLVGEDVDPDLAAALDVAGHRDTSRLDLAVGDPAGIERLEAVVAEMDLLLSLRVAATAPALLLAELGLARHQHQPSPPESSSFVGSSTCCFWVVVSGASATGAGVVSTSGSTTGCSRPSAETPLSSVRGFSTRAPRLPPGPPVPPGRRRWRTGPRPSRSGLRRRPACWPSPRPSGLRPPRRRAWSCSPRRPEGPVSRPVSKPSGMISPLLIQTLTPMRPKVVFPSAKP